MGERTFHEYGARAQSGISDTEVAGRYKIQKEAECRIVNDVKEKLELQPEDRVLEIGCGSGQLLIPISFMVGHVKGIDHKNVRERLRRRFKELDSNLEEGSFLEWDTKEEVFDKILIYSVIHCLEGLEEAKRFTGKALQILAPGGILLVGDIPNSDMKVRFQQSAEGAVFCEEWAKRVQVNEEVTSSNAVNDDKLFKPDDQSIGSLLAFLNTDDTSAFLLPQKRDLPFGNTRVDILVKKHQ